METNDDNVRSSLARVGAQEGGERTERCVSTHHGSDETIKGKVGFACCRLVAHRGATAMRREDAAYKGRQKSQECSRVLAHALSFSFLREQVVLHMVHAMV